MKKMANDAMCHFAKVEAERSVVDRRLSLSPWKRHPRQLRNKVIEVSKIAWNRARGLCHWFLRSGSPIVAPIAHLCSCSASSSTSIGTS